MNITDPAQERLLEAAGRLFAERGYEGATIRAICEQAGANIAAVNYHFGDKERLYIEAVKHAHKCRVENVPLPAWPEGTPPEVKLRDFIRATIIRMIQDDSPSWHMQLVMREMVEPSAACAELVRDNIRPLANQLLTILNELLPPDLPAEKRYMIGFSIVGQCFWYRVNKPIIALLMGEAEYAKLSADKLAEHIADFSLTALGYAEPLRKEQP